MSSAQPKRARLEVEDVGKVTIVKFVEERIRDEVQIREIGKQLFELVDGSGDEPGRKILLLNLGNVKYLSSAALGPLLTLNKKLSKAGGILVLCEIDDQLYEVFGFSNLEKLFRCVRKEATALTNLGVKR